MSMSVLAKNRYATCIVKIKLQNIHCSIEFRFTWVALGCKILAGFLIFPPRCQILTKRSLENWAYPKFI